MLVKELQKNSFNTLKKEMGLNEETEEPKKDNLKRFLIVSASAKGDTTSKLINAVEDLGHKPTVIRADTAYIGDVDGDNLTIENIDKEG